MSWWRRGRCTGAISVSIDRGSSAAPGLRSRSRASIVLATMPSLTPSVSKRSLTSTSARSGRSISVDRPAIVTTRSASPLAAKSSRASSSAGETSTA
jgi:hypothetical protein